MPSKSWCRRWALSILKRVWVTTLVALFALPVVYFLVSQATLPAIIRWRASETAGSNAFCIEQQTGPRAEYEPITKWAALGFVWLPHDWMYPSSYYAILEVEGESGPTFYNWSFASMNFVPAAPYFVQYLPSLSRCSPSRTFFDGLT